MSTNPPVVFNFVSNTLRVVMRDGEPWFVAADVCTALDHSNVTQALKRLDEDEQALISNEGIHRGSDQVNVVNESGLYSLILGSRKPEAKKFKKWVTSEVLPAIRKTGRYVAPSAPPESAHETLTPKDMGNLTRMVWVICGSLWGQSAWTQAVWYRLRVVTGLPAPHRFQVRHLPILASEIRRICALTQALKDAQNAAGRMIIKRVLRGGEAEGPVLEEINRQLSAAVAEDEAEILKLLERWREDELGALTERKGGNYHSGHLAAYAEPGTEQGLT